MNTQHNKHTNYYAFQGYGLFLGFSCNLYLDGFTVLYRGYCDETEEKDTIITMTLDLTKEGSKGILRFDMNAQIKYKDDTPDYQKRICIKEKAELRWDMGEDMMDDDYNAMQEEERYLLVVILPLSVSAPTTRHIFAILLY